MPMVPEKVADHLTPSSARHVRLFRNGANQAVRIPKEFELPGKEAIMRREGNRLIIEPASVKVQTLAELMDSWEDLDEPFPDMDEGLLPLDDIEL